MASITIRSSDELSERPERRLKLGSLLRSIAQEAGGLTEAEVESFVKLRDKTSVTT